MGAGYLLSITTTQVTAIWGSSLEVMVSVHAERPVGGTGEQFHCADAFFTVVSVDQAGRPVRSHFELAPSTHAEVGTCQFSFSACVCGLQASPKASLCPHDWFWPAGIEGGAHSCAAHWIVRLCLLMGAVSRR